MNSNLKTILLIILHIILAPVLFLEYFTLFWIWAGDGNFTLISIPCFFAIFLAMQLFFLFRNKNKAVKTIFIYTSLFITPIISVLLTYLTAMILGISINIM